jgi:hypothetical protein
MVVEVLPIECCADHKNHLGGVQETILSQSQEQGSVSLFSVILSCSSHEVQLSQIQPINKFIGIVKKPARADQSAPTADRASLFICIILALKTHTTCPKMEISTLLIGDDLKWRSSRQRFNEKLEE